MIILSFFICFLFSIPDIWVNTLQSSEDCGLKNWSSFSSTTQVTISVSELQRIMESPFRVAIGCPVICEAITGNYASDWGFAAINIVTKATFWG